MRQKQLSLNMYSGRQGGRRPGSGRKRIHSKGVAHRTREKVTGRTPLHINFKFKTYIRNKQCLRLLKRAIMNSRAHGLKIIHFSMQSNHMHFIVEAETNQILTKGMRSLTVTFAKGLKAGRVQIERYHLHVLKTVKETKNALMYVLFNQQKHERGISSTIDHYSSLLSTDFALTLIRKFAKTSGVLLKVGRRDQFYLDKEDSYLMKKAIHLSLT